MIRRWSIAFASFAVLSIGAPVFAQEAAANEEDQATESSSYDELTELAEDHFQRGEHDEAIAVLKRAHRLRPHANTLYNIARVYEDQGDLATAVEYFDRFLISPGVSLKHRREALERRQTLNEILTLQTASRPQPAPEKTVTSRFASTPQDDARAHRAARSERPSARVLGGVVTATGALTLATGGVFGVMALNEQAEFNRTTNLDVARSSARRARSYARISDVLLISGGALGVTGLILWITAPGKESEATSALRITVGPDAVATTWRVNF